MTENFVAKSYKDKEKVDENRQLWLKKMGFNAEGETWSIVGDDTFCIKDWLKEQGCKFNPTLKWHSPVEIALPDGYSLIKFNFDDIYIWDAVTKNMDMKNNAIEFIDKQFKIAKGPSLSEYIGEVGDRIRNITAVYKSVRGFTGQYGWTNIYTFESENNVIVWFTSKELELEKGAVVDLTGTVKKFEEFRGVKTTVITRATVKEIE